MAFILVFFAVIFHKEWRVGNLKVNIFIHGLSEYMLPLIPPLNLAKYSLSIDFRKDPYFYHWDIWKMTFLIKNLRCIFTTFIKTQTFPNIF